jgi:ABC-type nitrate/sulfonate/bicarbonate transport system ATPase subunit
VAQSVLVIAESGSGKSTSLRGLNPDETFIINIANKPLPFKGWKNKYMLINKENPLGNLSNVSSVAGVLKVMNHVSEKMPHIKNLVIDDWQFMSSFEYFDRSAEKGWN